MLANWPKRETQRNSLSSSIWRASCVCVRLHSYYTREEDGARAVNKSFLRFSPSRRACIWERERIGLLSPPPTRNREGQGTFGMLPPPLLCTCGPDSSSYYTPTECVLASVYLMILNRAQKFAGFLAMRINSPRRRALLLLPV